jgi:glycosyltransferase involved in cell wall biosynthesis
VAVSKSTQKFILNQQIAPASHLSVIYGAIKPIKTTKYNSLDQLVIGTLGQITWIKGIDLIIRSLAHLIDDYPNIKLIIGGNGPETKTLTKLVSRLKIDNYVEFIGNVSHHIKFYHSINIYIQASYSESFGLAPLEAMSASIPTIASNAGALPEIVRNKVDGLIFQRGDHQDLRRTIISLISSKDLYQKLSKAGPRRAAEFSVKRMSRKYHSLYQKILYQ